MKLSLAQIRQIQEYLEQGISIRKIATLCQVGRNTVRRYQRNSHRSRILSEEHCFLNNNIDIIRKILVNFHSKCKMVRRSFGVLQQSIPVPSSSRGPFPAGCLYGIFPS